MQKTNEALLTTVLLVTTLAHVLDFVIMMPLGPKLMREFSMTAATFGHIVSVYTFAAAISSFWGTIWIDRVNRRTALLGLVIGFTLGNIVCAWAPSVSWLIFGRVLAGIFGGVMGAVVYSIIGQVISLKRRGRAAGVLGTAFPLVSIVGIPIGLKIADYFGWRAAFIMVVALSLLSLLMCFMVLPNIEPEKAINKGSGMIKHFHKLLSYPAHKLGLVTIILAVFGGFTIVPFIAPFLVNNEYIIEDQLYLIYLVGGCFAIISSRLIGIWSDRVGKSVALSWMCVMTIVALAIFTNLPHHSLMLVLASTSLAMIALPGRFVCIMAWLTLIASREMRGAFMSFVATMQQLTIGFASIIGGYLVGESSDGRFDTFWLAGAFAITANGFILLLSSKIKHAEQLSARHDS